MHGFMSLFARIFFLSVTLWIAAGLAACSQEPTSNSTSKSKSDSPKGVDLASGLANADFELLDGTKFKIHDKKGKVLLLNIWGTWCGPCRQEIPHLVEIQAKYPDTVEVVGLNIGDGSGTAEPNELINSFAASMRINYTMARSPNASTVQFYQVTKQQVVPQTLLVDSEGRLRGVFIGGGDRVIKSMKSTLEKTLNEG